MKLITDHSDQQSVIWRISNVKLIEVHYEFVCNK